MPENSRSATKFSVLILAAGKATRFKSEHTKVLHRLAGRLLGEYVLDAALGSGPAHAWMVVGHEGELVRKAFARPGLTFVFQREQRGTGDAVMAARAEIEKDLSPAVIVLVGDAPLLTPETLRQLAEFQARSQAAAVILTMRLDDPDGYGRIIRSAGNRVRTIIEQKDCTPTQRRIREVSSGIICFARKSLLEHLNALTDVNAQREFLLTDMVSIFNRRRLKVLAFPVEPSRQVLGVNDRAELSKVEKIIRRRKAETLMRDGVTLVDPETTVIDDGVEIGRDSRIEPGSHLLGSTKLGRDCLVQSYALITDCNIGERVTVRPFSVLTGSEVASGATIGPFAHLRDGAEIGAEARIGNFVEVKKTRVGRSSRSLHLTYLGDATLGERVNVGAGTVTCNYDGEKKNPTIIGDDAFIGSGSMLVAPLEIGHDAYVAAGSTLTEDVPAESLAVARARQVNKEGWAREQAQRKPLARKAKR